ncbi:hypothetical protein [Amycolatopsis sp. NPDC004625]|uniref:hypothetical protein n=1 Tax=Amycolatopsis sp. NPDC004625 TaxID=3154670 RepID=UPI0033B393A7
MPDMDAVVAEARRMIEDRRSVFDLLGFLRGEESFPGTPFTFLRVLHEAGGFSLVDSRELLSMFELDWRPGAPAAEIERQWAAMLDSRS